MAIDRFDLISRHNPVLEKIEYKSPISVGNGEFAFTADITGLQTLYDEYCSNLTPLCTMSQWGWHTTPVSKDKYAYTYDDLVLTEYDYADRKVLYAVKQQPGNEDVYFWLRKNPHKFNLGRLSFIYNGERVKPEDISDIKQTLYLYEGILESNFSLHGVPCRVRTYCHYKMDSLAVEVESEMLKEGLLSVRLKFPYGSPDITASDWDNITGHESNVIYNNEGSICIERKMDKTVYYAVLKTEADTSFMQKTDHDFRIEKKHKDKLYFTLTFIQEKDYDKFASGRFADIPDIKQVFESSTEGWKSFWETGGIVKLHNSKDPRAFELERRIILSMYQLRVNCCGLMPPQETGLFCNSWHGKFHLEMYPWHQAYLPLWNHTELLKPSLNWYLDVLPKAITSASRNGFSGAKWPKQVAYDGIDSPSPIATLLIWQQPHIIYMLELAYQAGNDEERNNLLNRFWLLIKETADYMADLVVYNRETEKYDLIPPIIPAQEAHDPTKTINPIFEVEYWRFGLSLAAKWAKRLEKGDEARKWLHIAENMAKLPVKDGLYLAHQNCLTTYEEFNVDHPIMTAIYGFIDSDRVDKEIMKNTLYKIIECWDFNTTWGWDFALMAMTATRLGNPELAVDLLLMDTPNNNYAKSGHNSQIKREDLPVYLPGNGSLLLAVALMTAGYAGCNEKNPGFPKDGNWDVEYEDIRPFPY